MSTQEYFPIVDENGTIMGKTTRHECHNGSSFILHPVVHLHIFNSKGELFLQKRSMNKDIQAGKWDTSVGGHVDFGEDIATALRREVAEELGIKNFEPQHIKTYVHQSKVERELVYVYRTVYDGEININPTEIEEGRFWSLEEINSSITQCSSCDMNANIFTSNFCEEFTNIILIL